MTLLRDGRSLLVPSREAEARPILYCNSNTGSCSRPRRQNHHPSVLSLFIVPRKTPLLACSQATEKVCIFSAVPAGGGKITEREEGWGQKELGGEMEMEIVPYIDRTEEKVKGVN